MFFCLCVFKFTIKEIVEISILDILEDPKIIQNQNEPLDPFKVMR